MSGMNPEWPTGIGSDSDDEREIQSDIDFKNKGIASPGDEKRLEAMAHEFGVAEEEMIREGIDHNLEEAQAADNQIGFVGSAEDDEISRNIWQPRIETERAIADIKKKDPLRDTGKVEE
ncbi:MAG TPA: hypothetical protein VN420_05515 [Candidatus Fimivivens sp.]|nr:hypothetical protein [Candidatus Fimivivens sp.]